MALALAARLIEVPELVLMRVERLLANADREHCEVVVLGPCLSGAERERIRSSLGPPTLHAGVIEFGEDYAPRIVGGDTGRCAGFVAAALAPRQATARPGAPVS